MLEPPHTCANPRLCLIAGARVCYKPVVHMRSEGYWYKQCHVTANQLHQAYIMRFVLNSMISEENKKKRSSEAQTLSLIMRLFTT